MIAFAIAGLLPVSVLARDADIRVRNQRNEPVAHAVIVLLGAKDLPAKPDTVTVDQINKEFVPHVSAVPVGTLIRFPNNDNIRHHVYSFSPAKTFELPLYKDAPPAPVAFEKPGIVALGCNIHDWMTSYVYVGESRFLVVTDKDGVARLQAWPDKEWALEIWHPRLKDDNKRPRLTLALEASSGEIQIDEKPLLRPFRGAAAGKNY